MKRINLESVLGGVTAALMLGTVALPAWGGGVPWDEAELFFELNNTDGDLGIHSSVDGDPWKKLRITAPGNKKLVDIKASTKMRQQGLTQLFFESAEPTFDELTPEQFFQRFPEGTYEISGGGKISLAPPKVLNIEGRWPITDEAVQSDQPTVADISATGETATP